MTSRSFPPTPNHNIFTKYRVLFLALTVSASLAIFCSILYFLCHLWYSIIHRAKTIPFDANSPLKLQRFSYKELKQTTNGFHTENVIGKGGSSTVFKGKLKDGNFIAIKCLDAALCSQTEQEFQNELQILGGLTSPFLVTLLGYCMEKNKRALVFEYMPKRSLQEFLFGDEDDDGDGCLSLSWERRFLVILDVARALEFLHLQCDPPVIHGDIKPSNVLLDEEHRAKISDFGLSRIKVEEGEFGGNIFSQDLADKSQDLWNSQEFSGNIAAASSAEHINEVDFSLALQASSSSKYGSRVGFNVGGLNLNSLNHNACIGEYEVRTRASVKGKEITGLDGGDGSWKNKFVPSDDDFSRIIDHCKELNVNVSSVDEEKKNEKQWEKDWWWRQEESEELCNKDYVMDWIGSQMHTSNTDWDEEEGKNIPEETELENASPADKPDENKESVEEKCHEKHKKMQELWKEEENLAESSKNGCNLKNLQTKWNFYLCRCKNFRSEENQKQNGYDDQNAECIFRRGWRKKTTTTKEYYSPSIGGETRSRDLSSTTTTTSIRGTLSYVAPEHGVCEGFLMEKTDIYSFGVLILVVVSGRRPLLHVLASSPFLKLEKANLVSWCRILAKSGNILELVDERLRDGYNKEQASLCINLALSCLQKNPELRPHIGDIVKILKGDVDLPPPFPFEFSPSPPFRLYSSKS